MMMGGGGMMMGGGGMMMGGGGMMMGGGCVSGRQTVFNNGPVGGNSCSSSSDVSEADCLAAVLDLLPAGQTQGRTHLVAGSWGWVPPGCSVQSHRTHGREGDWAATTTEIQMVATTVGTQRLVSGCASWIAALVA